MRIPVVPTLSMLTLVLVLALVASSCSTSTDANTAATPDEESTASISAGDTSPDLAVADDPPADGASSEVPTDWVLPLDATVQDLTGYSEDAVVTAVNDARFDYIVGCMTAQGWEFDLSDLPPAAMTEEEKATRTVTGQAAYFLSLIDDEASLAESESSMEATEARSSGHRTAPGFQEDEHECWMQAATKFPNPIDSLWPWLATALDDLNHKVGQDERYVSAQADALACIAAEGYDFRTSDEGFNHFYDLASAVWDRHQNGDIDEDTARSELQDLSVEESAFTETEFTCSKEVGRVGYLVRAEYEEQFLADNGDRVALAAAEYKEKLELFREFLLARKDG